MHLPDHHGADTHLSGQTGADGALSAVSATSEGSSAMVFGKVTYIPVSDEGETYVVLDVHSVVYYRETGQFVRLKGGASITSVETGTATSCQSETD